MAESKEYKSPMDQLVQEDLAKKNAVKLAELEKKIAAIEKAINLNGLEHDILSSEIVKLKEKK